MTTDQPNRERNKIRQDCARKLRVPQVSDHFQAIPGCLLGEDWTSPRLVEMIVTSDGHLICRCIGEAEFKGILGEVDVAARKVLPEYNELHAYVFQPNRTFQQVTYLGFYLKGSIYPLLPKILATHDEVAMVKIHAARHIVLGVEIEASDER